MEIYLSCKGEQVRFPVIPSTIGVNRNATVDGENVIGLGQISINQGMNLKTIEFESFFPNQEYPFCQYRGFMKPYDFSHKIQEFMYSGDACRIIVTDSPTNMECYIQDFNTWEQDGTGDLFFNIVLIEHKKPKIERTRW